MTGVSVKLSGSIVRRESRLKSILECVVRSTGSGPVENCACGQDEEEI